MKIVCSIVFVLLSSFALVGQVDISNYKQRVMEIRNIEDPVARDTQLIWQYNYIAEELARHNDSRTDAYLDTLKQLANNSTWDMASGLYYRALGRYHDFRGNMSSALSFYDDAINELKVAKGDLKEIAFTYVLKGFLLSNAELYPECKKTLKQGIPYARKARSKNSLCLILDWFGDYYFYGLADTIDNKKALSYYLQVQELLPSISYTPIIADNHSVLSGVYARLNEDEKSNYHFKIADSLCTAHNLLHTRWGLYAEIANSLEKENDHEKANEYYVAAHNFMQKSTNIIFKSRVEKALWQNYKFLGNYEKALEHYENYLAMEDIMTKDEVEKKYAEIEAKYQLSEQENKLANERSKRLSTIRNFIVIILVITFISIIIIFRKNKELRQNFNLLKESQKETKLAIYKGETQERLRLAAELHDNVNTKLAAAKWQLEAISEESNNKLSGLINNTITVLSDAYDDVRNMSHNMVPANLESEGLVPALNLFLSKINELQKVNIELDTNYLDDSKIKHIVYPLYNIVLELVTNILKHADASQAKITMSTSTTHLYLSVKDNGIGYNTDNESTGFGLKSINNRIKSLKGTISIESNPQSGTYINILIPF